MKVCKYCGKEYDGDPGGSCCKDCAAEQRKTTLRRRVCTVCGASFDGGPSARYCPNCRAERQRERGRYYKKHGSNRKLGSTDICAVCGKEYVVKSGLQKYCPDCAEAAIREKDREASRRWNAENTTAAERKAVRKTAVAAIPCAVCGKMFYPGGGTPITCSPECSAELQRRRHAAYEKQNKDARNAYHKERLQARLQAMSPEELKAYREKVNARARENYKKRKKQDPDKS